MKTMTVSEFKTHALEMFGQIAKTKEPVLVTKRGKPLAEVIPFRERDKAAIPGRLAHTVAFEGDIESPIDVIWNACK